VFLAVYSVIFGVGGVLYGLYYLRRGGGVSVSLWCGVFLDVYSVIFNVGGCLYGFILFKAWRGCFR